MLKLTPRIGRRSLHTTTAGVCLTLSACSSALVLKPLPDETLPPVREHAVFVDGDGRALRVRTPSENSRQPRQMSPEEYDLYLARMMDAIRRDTVVPRRIMIVAHGGLNNLSTNLLRADDMSQSISAAGYYPILLIWESGLLPTYFEHLAYVRQGQKQEAVLLAQITTNVTIDLARGASRAPLTWIEQGTDWMRTTGWFTPEWQAETSHLLQNYEEWTNAQNAGTSTGSMDSATIHVSVGEFRAGRNENVGRTLLTFFTLPTKLIVSPLLDAVGGSAWRNMRRRTRTMFHTPQEFGPSIISAETYRPPSGAVAELAAALDTLIIQDSVAFVASGGPDTAFNRHDRWQITLIGHSMGAIVMNELVRHQWNLPYRNIVYMAAACSIRDWEASVLPYMEEHDSTRFYSLMLHPVVEARERNVGDLPPRGSLLEWLDDYMDDPETHTDRTMGKWANMAEATHLIPPGVRNRVYFRVFGYLDSLTNHGEGSRKPIKHGDFLDPDVPFYSESFWWPSREPAHEDQQDGEQACCASGP